MDNFRDFFIKLLEKFKKASIFTYDGINFTIDQLGFLNQLETEMRTAESSTGASLFTYNNILRNKKFSDFLKIFNQDNEENIELINEILPVDFSQNLKV